MLLHADIMNHDFPDGKFPFDQIQTICQFRVECHRNGFINGTIPLFQHIMHDDLNSKNQNGCRNPHNIQPAANGKSCASRGPDTCGCGQSADRYATHKNDTCAQERNPRNNIGSNSGCVYGNIPISQYVKKSIFRYNHHHRSP